MKSSPRIILRRQFGSALVITLSLLVLVSVCVLAFMSLVRFERQSGVVDMSRSQAEFLARSMGNVVVDDLLLEIAAGSTNVGTSTNPVYRALTNANSLGVTNGNMLPQRVIASGLETNTNFSRLYKQSIASNSFSGPSFDSSVGPRRASTVETWRPARNGRFISTNRWNAPHFIVDGFSSNSQLPNWIYVTSGGTNSSTGTNSLNPTTWSAGMSDLSSSDSVVGRVAYNVYEVGGAMDINVAGGLSSVTKQQLLASLSGAKIANIPGIGSSSASDSIVSWRNASSGGGNYLDYVATNGLKAGFFDLPTGDRRFISRQDLITYAKLNSSAGGISTNALPYLTHYSRGLDRPSGEATTNAAPATYNSEARYTDLNPNPLTVTHSSEVAISGGPTLKANDPVAFRRFPLRRIGLLSASTTDANLVKKHFGLTKVSDGVWTYDHGVPNRIYSLTEVKAQGREPDFFEMLQAAIVNGSLGTSSFEQPDKDTNPGYSMNIRGRDENTFRHVLAIGANIIDQYDTDSKATQINLGSSVSVFGIENLPYLSEIITTAYRPAAKPRTKVRGYLLFEVWNPHANAANTDVSKKLRVAITGGQATAQLYNTSYGTPGNAEKEFYDNYNKPVVSAYGVTDAGPDGMQAEWEEYYPERLFRRGGKPTPQGNGILFSPSNPGTVEFQNSVALNEPVMLSAPGAAGIPRYEYAVLSSSPATSIVDEQTPQSDSFPTTPTKPAPAPKITIPSPSNRLDSATDIKFAGIMLDEFDAPDDRVDGVPDGLSYGVAAPSCYAALNIIPISNSTALTIELQMEDSTAASGWRTYQKIENLVRMRTSNIHGGYGNVGTLPATEASDLSFIRPRALSKGTAPSVVFIRAGVNGMSAIDPRTSRFTYLLGPGNSAALSMRTNTSASSGQSFTNAQMFGQGWLWSAPPTATRQFSQLAANIANHESGMQYYQDPDGIVRRGDGEERSAFALANRIYPMLYGRADDRPVILDRPFTSVAEMGYAFRDVPWKTLDFWTADSGDGALLDYFTVEETALNEKNLPIKAGVINPNAASPEVLKAVIEDTIQRERTSGGVNVSSSIAGTIANAVATAVKTQSLKSIKELPALGDNGVFTGSGGLNILRKTEKEAFIRALTPVSEVNVWNLAIDVIAQAGRFSPGSSQLTDFSVQGEARYWIFVSIDRALGKVIDIQYESVTE